MTVITNQKTVRHNKLDESAINKIKFDPQR